MKLKDHYDWVVLGDHPAALLSAALMAQTGFSVLVLPLAKSTMTRMSKSGQCHDPETNFLMGVGRIDGDEGLLGQCLSQVGRNSSTVNLIRTGDEQLPEIVTPSSRFRLKGSTQSFFEELEREVGREVAQRLGVSSALKFADSQILSYWKKFPTRFQSKQKVSGKIEKWVEMAQGLHPSRSQKLEEKIRKHLLLHSLSVQGPARKWFSPRRRLKSLQTHPEATGGMGEICSGLWYGLLNQDHPNPFLVDLVHIFSLGRAGACFRGGMTAYRQFLLNLARALGATVPADMVCKRIFVESGKLVGVQVSQRGRIISVNGAALGCALEHAKGHLYYSGKTFFKKLKRGPKPVGWKFTLSLTVHAEAIPAGIGSRAIWKEGNAPALEVEVADPEDYHLGKTPNRLVFLRTTLPFTEESLTGNFQRTIAARMFKQLGELFPFLEFHIVRIYPDFRQEQSSADILDEDDDPFFEDDDFREAYDFKTTDQIPENLRIYSSEGTGALTGVDHLYSISGEAYPNLGSFGGTLAAIEATSWFAKKSGVLGEQGAAKLWDFLEL